MKNLIYLLPLVLMLLSSACSNEEPSPAAVFDMIVYIEIIDNHGNNLLNPNHEGFYDPRDIKIFYERNGQMEEFFEKHLNWQRNFRILPPEFERDYVMALVLDSEKTVIQWNEYESDTIHAEFYKTDFPSVRVTKLYFNGELKWDVADLVPREITIFK